MFQHGPIRSLLARRIVRIAARRRVRATRSGCSGGCRSAPTRSTRVASCSRRWRCRRSSCRWCSPTAASSGAFLSLAPLRWVGRISYGLYLWHWPVYLTLTQHTHRSRRCRVARRPARGELGARHPVVLRPRTAHPPGHVPPAAAEGRGPGGRGRAGRGGVRHHHRRRRLGRGDDHARAARRGAAGRRPPHRSNPRAPAPWHPTKVLLVGDSVAGTLGLGFQTIGAEHNLWVWNRGRLGCGLFYGGSVYEGGELLPVDPECDWHKAWPDELNYFKPDIALMLVGAWDILDREVDGHTVKFGTVEYDRSFLAAARRRHHGCWPPTARRSSCSRRRSSRDRSWWVRAVAVARVRPVARRPHQLALPRLPGAEPGSVHAGRPQPVRVAGGQVRRLDRRCPGARRRCALHPRRCDLRRPVAGAAARRRSPRASPPTPRSSTGPTRGGSGRSSGGSAARPARHREQPGRRRRDLVGDEEVRLVEPRADAGARRSRAPGRSPAARARSPTRTSCAAPCAGGRAGSRRRNFSPLARRCAKSAWSSGVPSRPCTVTSWKNSASSDSSSGPSNNDTWNGFSKSAGRFGRDHEHGAVLGGDPGELGDVLLGRDEVLDDVRRADPVDRAGPGADATAVHRREAQALRAPTRARRRSRSGGGSRRR